MEHIKHPMRRCAVYTRKSSEEGLEQDFNSLHAQREACEAFIRSQASEGWRLSQTHYDDSGLSGGTMERPALQRLLEDIRNGLVDVVVVYKVDRLTRSLADFAQMVEIFDANGVSFVAVTQQFNTTTSMGRLTLNVLLSFAQFEREVTGERIRDKITASKRKGIWMGGMVPLGYDVVDRRLVVNQAEAQLVQEIYQRYLELGSVRLLKEDLDRRGVASKVRLSRQGTGQAVRAFHAARYTNCCRIRSTSAKLDTSWNTIPANTNPSCSMRCGSRSSSASALGRAETGNRQPRHHRARWREKCSMKPASRSMPREPPKADAATVTSSRALWSEARVQTASAAGGCRLLGWSGWCLLRRSRYWLTKLPWSLAFRTALGILRTSSKFLGAPRTGASAWVPRERPRPLWAN